MLLGQFVSIRESFAVLLVGLGWVLGLGGGLKAEMCLLARGFADTGLEQSFGVPAQFLLLLHGASDLLPEGSRVGLVLGTQS